MGADALGVVNEAPIIRLNLGCGKKLLDGYVNCDLPDNHSGIKPDVECDLRKLPFPDDYADEVMAVHVLEHFYQWEAESVIQEWIRVLKPNGRLVLELPCFEKILKLACDPAIQTDNTKVLVFVYWGLYGDQRYRTDSMQHKWCYSSGMLIHLLREMGLKDLRLEEPHYHWPQRDMRVVGIK